MRLLRIQEYVGRNHMNRCATYPPKQNECTEHNCISQARKHEHIDKMALANLKHNTPSKLGFQPELSRDQVIKMIK